MYTFYMINYCGLLAILTRTSCMGNQVIPRCSMKDESCEFFLSLSEYRMMNYLTRTPENIGVKEMSTFHRYDSVSVKTPCHHHQRFMSKEEARTIPTGDGSDKLAYLFNATLPGPPIVVYKGQELIVHIRNDLINEGITVHWHGVRQHNTPWMDGVEGISHCIINPGDTFTYRFLADDAGTFWYHTHSSTQRTMGAYGPLIIMERSLEQENNERGSDPLPMMDKDFYLVVSDWFKRNSREIQEIVQYEAISFLNGWDVPFNKCFNSTKAPDGLDAGILPFQSGLINGKGFRYNKADDKPENNKLPLEEFHVSKGKKYRFRMISSAMAFVFRISIDHHKLHVIATDANDVVTRIVDYILIASGERYDFWIEADDPANLGLYWIRAETYELYDEQHKRITPKHTEAILRYNTSPTGLPISEAKECTKTKPCEILNCPFKHYTVDDTTICLPLTELQGTKDPQYLERSKSTNQNEKSFVEHFLNFYMALENTPGLDGEDLWTATVNGFRNQLFAVPPEIHPDGEEIQRVPCNCPIHEVCHCHHVIEVPLGSLVQLVLMVTVSNPPAIYNGLPHNVHLHGYKFDVLKMGYATYDNRTGFYVEQNADIDCFKDYCSRPQWRNSSWKGGHVPNTVSKPVQKDTLLIPVGGYAVVQFEANNPGYWYMHCHTEFHNEEGMSLVLKVGVNSDMAPAPGHMTDCIEPYRMGEGVASTGNSGLSAQHRDKKELFGGEYVKTPNDCTAKQALYKKVAIGLIMSSFILSLLNICLTCKLHRHSNRV